MLARRLACLFGLSAVMMLACAMHAPLACAAGFTIADRSASTLGNAMAGSGAAGYDASTIYFNPAAMQLLERNQLTLAGHMIRPRGSFSDQGGNTSGPATADAGETAFIPNLYYVHVPTENIRLGLGVYVPFGLRLSYPANWKGRYHSINSDLTAINIAPSVSFQLTPEIAVGVNIDVQYLKSTLENAVDFGALCTARLGSAICARLGLVPQQNDGTVTIKNHSWATGATFGLLYTPTATSRIGVTYRSSIRHLLNGQAEFRGVPALFQSTFTASRTNSSLTLPEQLRLSLYHQFTQAWALLADFSYERWRRFNVLTARFSNGLPDKVSVNAWRNSKRYALGLNYRPTGSLLLRSGIAYEETPVPDPTRRSPRPPDNDRIWLAFGFNYRLTGHVSLDAAYVHIFVKDAPINNIDSDGHILLGQFNGHSDIFSLQANWLF